MFGEKTKAEQQQILQDLLSGDRVVLICEKHKYTGGPKEMPHFGCKDCALVMWKCFIARIPKERQREVVEQIHERLAKVCERLDRGEDLGVNLHPIKTEIEKGIN